MRREALIFVEAISDSKKTFRNLNMKFGCSFVVKENGGEDEAEKRSRELLKMKVMNGEGIEGGLWIF